MHKFWDSLTVFDSANVYICFVDHSHIYDIPIYYFKYVYFCLLLKYVCFASTTSNVKKKLFLKPAHITQICLFSQWHTCPNQPQHIKAIIFGQFSRVNTYSMCSLQFKGNSIIKLLRIILRNSWIKRYMIQLLS